MFQDDVANLDSMLEVAIEATSQEREENKRKKKEDRLAARKESKTKYDKQSYRNFAKKS